MQMTCCTYEYDNFPASILVVLNVITLPKRFFFVVVLASLDEEVCEQGEAAECELLRLTQPHRMAFRNNAWIPADVTAYKSA